MYYDKQRRLWRITLPRGSKPRTRSFETETEARKFLAKLELGIADTTPSKAALSFDDLAERWVREYCKVEKSETLWAADAQQIKLHLSPSFGQVLIADLRATHLMAIKAEMREKKAHGKKHQLSARTINKVITLAKCIMQWAAEKELVQRNPFREVKRLKVTEQDYSWWGGEELERFLAHVRPHDPEMARLVEVAAHTGLRRGELAALKGSSLDFRRRKIRVAHSYSVELGKLLPPKGKVAADVPMNQAVLRALEPKRFLKAGDFIFPREMFSDLCHQFQAWCEDAGVTVLRFHDLRHGFASNLAAAGVSPKTIMDLMRHKSLAMTQRYMHLSPDHLSGVTEILCTQTAHETGEKSKTGAPRGT